MSTFAIGDVQGCYRTLKLLLQRIRFKPARDRLWLVGDLVNRGSGSLQALRWAKGLGERAEVVLGNHDLHLLAVSYGLRDSRPKDTLERVLAAPDREALIDWLRFRPLIHRRGDDVLVHAGIPPQWPIERALDLAREAEEALKSPDPRPALLTLNDELPDLWDEGLEGSQRLGLILQSLTRMRICTPTGRLRLDFNGSPRDIPPGYLPWFAAPQRATAHLRIFCGHWAALGLSIENGVHALESGCVWGGPMTACRLEDGKIFQEPCAEPEILEALDSSRSNE